MTRLFVFLFLFCSGSFAVAKSKGRLFIIPGAEYLYTDTATESLAGAEYSKRFRNTFIASFSLGYRLFGNLYLGVRSELWFAKRRILLNNTITEDNLRYYGVGAEIGIYKAKPRVVYIVSVGALDPLEMKISTASGDFTRAKRIGLYARGSVGVRFSKTLSLLLSAGYRHVNLGNLVNAAGTPFIAGNGDVDFSGYFGGLGIGIHF